jgi:GT2 family glycosyltransferase
MCWRLRSRGYRLVCVPQSIVYHVGGATLNAESPRKTFLNFRNSLLMLYKNSREEDLKHVMCVRFWLDYIAAAKFLLEGHFANAKAVYEARKAYHQLKPEYTPKRKENLEKRTLSTIPELMRDSLILAFYLKGKRTFKVIKDRR